MPNMNCCVCGASLAQYDEVAANFHLNACLDSGGSTAAARSASSSREPDSSGLAFLARTEVPQCPLCEKELPAEELQDHVDACLIAHEENGQSRQANDTVGVTQDGLFDDAAEVCPSCLLEWNAIDVPRQDRELHVADCLSQAQALREDDDDDSDEAMTESRLQATIEKFKSKSNGFGKLRGAWKGEGKHTSVTPGIIPVLQALLEKSSSTRLAVLCTAKVEHIKSQFGDFGWGCGYKSACMVYSALRHVDQYRDLLREELNTESDSKDAQGSTRSEKRRADGLTSREDVADIPSIGELQQIAEVAWEAGFDEEGRKHFQGKLVGSRRWIGTSEVYTMFTWLGIR